VVVVTGEGSVVVRGGDWGEVGGGGGDWGGVGGGGGFHKNFMKSGMQVMLCTCSPLHALKAEHSFSVWDLEAFFDFPPPRLPTIGAQTVHRSDPQMPSLRVSV